jgi:hypothetical protein
MLMLMALVSDAETYETFHLSTEAYPLHFIVLFYYINTHADKAKGLFPKLLWRLHFYKGSLLAKRLWWSRPPFFQSTLVNS